MTNINKLLQDHVTLTVECLDRIYLNGYIPTLQLPGQLVEFLIEQRERPIPSPALLGQITQQFVESVKSFAAQNGIPIVHFKSGERKDDIAAEYRKRFNKAEGVVFIGVAQEKAQAFKGRKKDQTGYVGFEYTRESVYVNHYYFYIQRLWPGLHQSLLLCTVPGQSVSERPRVGQATTAPGRNRFRALGQRLSLLRRPNSFASHL